MLQTRILLSKRYSRRFRYFLKLPTKIQPTLRKLEKEIQKTPNYLIPFYSCPICRCKKSTVVSEISRFNLPMEIQVCEYCGLIFNVGHFSNEFMLKYYKYYFYLIRRPGSKRKKLLGHIKENSNAWKRKEFIKKHLGEKYNDLKIVVEVGCGDGGNLYPFFCEGMRTFGCDLDEGAINQGKRLGLELYIGDINCLIDKGIRSSLIILPHVLAHISDLNDFLEKIFKIINPKGFLYIESDGIFSELKAGIKKHNNLLWYFQFDFIMCFELRTLSYLLNKNGFNLEYGDESIKSIFSLQHKKNESPIDFIGEVSDNKGEVLKTIYEIEKNYLKQGLLKTLYRQLKGIYHFIKNITIFSIIDCLSFLGFNNKPLE